MNNFIQLITDYLHLRKTEDPTEEGRETNDESSMHVAGDVPVFSSDVD